MLIIITVNYYLQYPAHSNAGRGSLMFCTHDFRSPTKSFYFQRYCVLIGRNQRAWSRCEQDERGEEKIIHSPERESNRVYISTLRHNGP